MAQAEGVTTAAAVRVHAREAEHDQASVRRVTPSGIVQRWRTEADRERRRAEERASQAQRRPETSTADEAAAEEAEAEEAASATPRRPEGWYVHTAATSGPTRLPTAGQAWGIGCLSLLLLIVVLGLFTEPLEGGPGGNGDSPRESREECRERYEGAGDGTVDWRGICDLVVE
ncbi:hypothetical protein ACIRRX_03120 [Streptomyces bacillaris]